MKYLLIAFGIILFIIFITLLVLLPSGSKEPKSATIRTFEECADAGNLVVETVPRECHTKNKQVYVEIYNGVQLQEVIEVKEPKVNAEVSSPFKLTGAAVGDWYANNVLNVKLVDINDNVMMNKLVRAIGDTNTQDKIPFAAAIEYDASESAIAKLIIERTNPSFSRGQLGPLVIPLRIKKN